MYSCSRTGSTATASWLNEPSAGRIVPCPACPGAHSHTCPRSYSSHDSQVPQGVRPPAQLAFVPARIRYAPRIDPLFPNRIAELPAPVAAIDSELDTRIQPPSPVANVACPSQKMCHG